MYTNQDYQYVPTSIEVYKSEFKINEQDYILSIADISGNCHDDLYIQMRNYFYLIEKKIDTILLCFSLTDPNSYVNIVKKVCKSFLALFLLAWYKNKWKHFIKYNIWFVLKKEI